MTKCEGFILPELIIESVIRDGLLAVKAKPEIIDSVFNQLNRVYNQNKYTGEIAKIKAFVQRDIPVVFSYGEVDQHPNCFSIMIGLDDEDKKRAHLSDDYGTTEETITDEEELEALVKVSNVIVQSYDPISGKLQFDPATDLTDVYRYMIFKDGSDIEHEIITAISNEPGDKFVFIKPNSDVNVVDPGLIKSSLGTKITEMKGVTGDEKIVVGTHSKDALSAKYLYILLKYFIISRKHDIIQRGLYVSSYSGSDFNRDSDFQADKVYTRFLTISGKIDDTWRQDLVEIIDNLIIDGKPIP